MEGDYTIEEADALTGPLIGLPSSASFRMLDLVGLDVWADIGPNLYEAIPNDPLRERFLLPDFQKQMVERKWLGEKTGQGFYKKVVTGRREADLGHRLEDPRIPSASKAPIRLRGRRQRDRRPSEAREGAGQLG